VSQRAIVAIVISCVVGCSAGSPVPDRGANLPDFAKPRVWELPRGSTAASDAVRYRELTRDDFRAKEPHPIVAEHATRVGAHLCANVVAALEIRLRIEPLANAGASWQARPTQPSSR
jgi:hypothetical protein